MLLAYQYWESGLDNYWGDDPPAWLPDAVAFYHRTLERVRYDEWERERAKHAAKQTIQPSDGERVVIRG